MNDRLQVSPEIVTPDQSFWRQLTNELLFNCYTWLPDNTDTWRFAEPHPFQRKIKDVLLRVPAKLGFYKEPGKYHASIEKVMNAGPFDQAMACWTDDASRELLVKLIAYRILGSRHYRLPLNTPSYWQARRSIPGYVTKPAVIKSVPTFGTLDEFDYEGIRLVAHAIHILNTFIVEQYRCRRAGIGVRQGDIVIDGGACWGDTSLYFARQAEHIFAYECVPFNIALFQRNMDSNPGLAPRITLIPKALWDVSGETLTFTDDGTASRADSAGTGPSVETQTIDDLVSEQNLKRVDLIKMDIEGAETKALLGAERTIRRFRPRLAICVYHSLCDYIRIPEWVSNLDLGYRLYLDHFSIYHEESVLFADASSSDPAG
ncbi:hypothetical protein SBA3_1420026 [Candidatus Sulfopaludibacter sp. SbA3]|nr:hypothetical protein SBA3_1420026 [Candidatus Sulfopaludibacter sp. SbA3]